MQFDAFCVEFDAKWIFLDPRRWIDVKRYQSALNCVELISTQFTTLERCVCVCVCVCVCMSVSVCVWCVWVVCVWCVCVSEWVCMCCILLLSLIKYKKYMWCVLYTHTHTLTCTHSHSLTLARLHTRARAHTINTQKVWICVDYNSTQFDSFWANWSCTAPIQCYSI